MWLFIAAILMPSNADLRKDPMVRLGMLFFVFLAFSIVWHRLTLPESFPRTGSARRHLSVLYFVVIAYAISRSRILTPWRLLATAFCGLLFYLMLSFDSVEWRRAFQGVRVDFGIYNAQHTGVVFATCAIAFSVFTGRFYKWTKKLPFYMAAACLVVWSSALVFSFWGVFVAQTRGVWLGLAVMLSTLPFFISLAYIINKHALSSLRKPLLGGFTVMFILGALAFGFGAPEVVSNRVAAEKVSWDSLRLAATHEKANLSSIEVRVASWSAATEWIMERPLLGWGGRGPKPLIRQSEYFSDAFKERFGHLHNSYLEILVEVGVIGAGFIVALIFLLGRSSIRSYRQGIMPTDVFVFSWLFFVFWVVVNMFESYIAYPSGTCLVAIVAALFYCFCIKGEDVCEGYECLHNKSHG